MDYLQHLSHVVYESGNLQRGRKQNHLRKRDPSIENWTIFRRPRTRRTQSPSFDGRTDGWTRGQEVTAVLVRVCPPHSVRQVWLSDSAAVNSHSGRFRSALENGEGGVRVAIGQII